MDTQKQEYETVMDLSEVSSEWPDLPVNLLPLCQVTKTEPNVNWTNAQVRLIAGPLLNSKPENWKGKSCFARLRLLQYRYIEEPLENDVQLFCQNAAIFQSLTTSTDCAIKSRCITADDIYPLVDRATKKLTSKVANELADALKDVASIDYAASSPKALDAYTNFRPKWEKYLFDHPQMLRVLDTFIVIAAVGGVDVPVWPCPAGGILPPTLNGQNYAWPFSSERDAAFWCGVVRQAFPGTRLWMINTTSPVAWM